MGQQAEPFRRKKDFSKNAKRNMVVSTQGLAAEATSLSTDQTRRDMTDSLDALMGFDRIENEPDKIGWLINMHATTVTDAETGATNSAMDYYFLDDEGGSFKSTLKFDPYFLVACKARTEAEVEEFLHRKLDGIIKSISREVKEDLEMPNHLLGYRRTFLRLTFNNVSDLLQARLIVSPIVQKNRLDVTKLDLYAEMATTAMDDDEMEDDDEDVSGQPRDAEELIYDMREFDVPYHVRVAIDKNIRIGKWYTVRTRHGITEVIEMPERVARPDPVILAFDIETTKLPLKFPDALIDQVMMISYMIDGEGFLITNREIVSKDIEDFEYTPRPELQGIFTIFNEENEKAVLERFFDHIREAKPTVIATFNGDFFDWPFVDKRASINGIDMFESIGFKIDNEGEYKSTHCAHMDCFRWVKRDSYLPQGSQGLKAVTTAKLGYDPIELDPELMTKFAYEQPQTLSEYSVSDAVATYYLYMKYVHPFIFSLCNIIPLNPDEVLRKGTGTLCEMLLMVQAYEKEIVLPIKHKEEEERFFEGHLLESETYVGGHVESLESGVFRSDIPEVFKVDTTAIDELKSQLHSALKFTIEIEEKKNLQDVENYQEVYDEITSALDEIKQHPDRIEEPKIYHLDVASMYPNIMITNRLQPDSMITEEACSTCDFNRPGKTCDRRLPWSWRGDYFPAKKDEYNMIKSSLRNELFPGRTPNMPMRTFDELPQSERSLLIKKRLSDYTKKVYHRLRETKTLEREAIICQRENPFYVDTVRSFRDRRYDFKGLQKVWKGKVADIPKSDTANLDEAKKMVILYDSLQLAHKVILNSFYGYVMRKGSRWYSMEMAGVTCLTGATIIQMARQLVQRIGRPLELDTDGIWCIIPKRFPENYSFKLKGGKKLFISYPCVMLNHLVHEKYTNDQYQTLIDPMKHKYETSSENSIFFEVDGPYRAMILPTSKEENKNLKKRYAVFNHDGTLAELKGFEVKRRGELKLIKIFQTEIFKVFLEGSTLEECYQAVGAVSNRWLDVLESKGANLADEELIGLISENRSMSKTLEEYGTQKSSSISTAKRLAEFLGDQMVKDKGLACKYVIAADPRSAPVTERAIPIDIFSAEYPVKRHFLRRWLKDPSLETFDPRDILDWNYYKERLGSVIQKIITIPAALQKIPNPVPRVTHPDWLVKRIEQLEDRFKQQTLGFKVKERSELDVQRESQQNVIREITDLEDIGRSSVGWAANKPAVATFKRKIKDRNSVLPPDPVASLPPVKPPITGSYNLWLKYQKQKWKVQREARVRRRHLFGESTEARRPRDLAGMIQSAAVNTFSKTWQLLQLKPADGLGIVKAIVLIDRKVQTVNLTVPRTVYVNFRDENFPDIFLKDCEVEKVNKFLRSGISSKNLFKVTMPESLFCSEMGKCDSFLNSKNVEGVYETSVDGVSRCLFQLGNACTINQKKPGVLKNGMEKGFPLRDLTNIDVNDEYLKVATIDYIFIYHCVMADREIICLVPTATESEAVIFVHESLRQSDKLPNIDRIYEDIYSKRVNQHKLGNGVTKEPFVYGEKKHFDIQYLSSEKKFCKSVNEWIEKFKARSAAPMVLLHSASKAVFSSKIKMATDIATVELRCSEADLSIQLLGWQSFVAKRIVALYFGLSSWVTYLTDLARYANIPICNLHSDDIRFLIDVAYARRLIENGVILWWSPEPAPDHAGYENDVSLESLEDLDIPSVNNPGSYTTACIELEVRNLAINTVLTSAVTEESGEMAEAQRADEDEPGSGLLFAENAYSAAAINVLRELIRNLWDQALHGSSNADAMVHNFLFWVSSPESLLYDRQLHFHVQTLSKQAYLQLAREFKRLGSRVIFSNENHLILQTTKPSIENAFAYSQYIVKSIKAKPLFNYLDLNIKEYWDYLLWMDEANYGGFACDNPTFESGAGNYETSLTLYMHWHIKKFLPLLCQQEFHDWMMEFIDAMHKAKAAKTTSLENSTQRLTQVPTEEGEKTVQEAFKKVITDLREPLLKRIELILKKQNDPRMWNQEVSAQFAFPFLPGSRFELQNPALQLVKFLCAAFMVVKNINIEVRMLRRDLLALFDVKEFSTEASFQDPSSSLQVRHLFCRHCCLSKDIDLCRDDSLIMENSDGSYSSPESFSCVFCGHDLDRVEIEEHLISDLQRLILSYQMQDLRCSKCRKIKPNDLSAHCTCSGEWTNTMFKDEFLPNVKTYENVAHFYDFKMLQEVVEFVQ